MAWKGEGGSTFALKALLCQAVEEGATVVAPSELHVVVDFEPDRIESKKYDFFCENEFLTCVER